MIGASGPSISTMQLSTPRPHSADMTCSTVETKTPEPSPRTVASSVAVTARAVARSSRSGSPLMPQRTNNDAGIGVGGIERESDGKAGMNADAGDRGAFAKRGLLARFHCSSPRPLPSATWRLVRNRHRPQIRNPFSPHFGKERDLRAAPGEDGSQCETNLNRASPQTPIHAFLPTVTGGKGAFVTIPRAKLTPGTTRTPPRWCRGFDPMPPSIGLAAQECGYLQLVVVQWCCNRRWPAVRGREP